MGVSIATWVIIVVNILFALYAFWFLCDIARIKLRGASALIKRGRRVKRMAYVVEAATSARKLDEVLHGGRAGATAPVPASAPNGDHSTHRARASMVELATLSSHGGASAAANSSAGKTLVPRALVVHHAMPIVDGHAHRLCVCARVCVRV